MQTRSVILYVVLYTGFNIQIKQYVISGTLHEPLWKQIHKYGVRPFLRIYKRLEV